MNNVVFLSSDNINAQTGAAKFARLLISKPEMWKKQGICALFFPLDQFTLCWENERHNLCMTNVFSDMDSPVNGSKKE